VFDVATIGQKEFLQNFDEEISWKTE